MTTSSKSPYGDAMMDQPRRGFTLIELLVVVGIIAILAGIVGPALSRARTGAKATVCMTRLKNIGHGLAIYAHENHDYLVPGRMPKVNDEQWQVDIEGGRKYRPTFLAMMATQIGSKPFEDPQPTKNSIDRFNQPGDRQNYADPIFVCPEVPGWTDERNGAYGYNYQFLGNSRLRDKTVPDSYKNWPVLYSSIKSPAACVAVADCIGTAASFSRNRRSGYQDNLPGDSGSGRSIDAVGNEGFNLDPPWVDLDKGEVAINKNGNVARTAVDIRHAKRGSVLWVDGHSSGETLKSLGYTIEGDDVGVVGDPNYEDLAAGAVDDESKGAVGLVGNNRKWHTKQKNVPWIE